MFPVALDLKRIPIFLTGQGELLTRRRAQLEQYGATRLVENMERASIVMVAGLPREEAEKIVNQAHALGKLVNVEDINDLCDFYFTANVVRGDLVIAVSTSGASPTLARKIRDHIASLFGAEWSERMKEIASLRHEWKKQGKNMKDVVAATERHARENGWLSSSPSPASAGEGRGGGVPMTAKDPLPNPPPLRGRGDKTGEAA